MGICYKVMIEYIVGCLSMIERQKWIYYISWEEESCVTKVIMGDFMITEWQIMICESLSFLSIKDGWPLCFTYVKQMIMIIYGI